MSCLEVELGGDLHKVLLVGKTFEGDLGRLTDGAAPTVTPNHVSTNVLLRAIWSLDLKLNPVFGFEDAQDLMAETHIEVGLICIAGCDITRQFVLLILEDKRELELIFQVSQIELRNQLVRLPIPVLIGFGNEPAWNYGFCHV